MLIRLARRKTSIEPTVSARQLAETEFHHKGGGLDLDLSVYDVDGGEVLRVQAEHEAGENLDPKTRMNFAIPNDHGVVAAEPCCNFFAFRNGAHRAVAFSDEEEILMMSEVMISNVGNVYQQLVRHNDVRAFGRGKIATGDAEWLALRDHPGSKVGSW